VLTAILAVNLAMVIWRQTVRAICSWQVYGWQHACTVPLRAPWGNFINLCATVRALATFARARAARRPLHWIKTAHQFPSHESFGRACPLSVEGTRVLRPAWTRGLGLGISLPRVKLRIVRPTDQRIRRAKAMPPIKLRVVLPGWVAIHRRLSITLEYRRVR
jgi:hypothetical protein